MKAIAEVRGGSFVKLHVWPDDAPVATHKLDSDGGPIFRPYVSAVPPTFDPLAEIVEGPALAVVQQSVTEQWTKRTLTAQEISDRKDASVNTLSGGYAPTIKIVRELENEIRDLRGKLNAVIDATAVAVAKYPAAQVSSVTLAQIKNAIKAAL